MLKIYNSLTKQKEWFTPITPNQIKLYVCGITVYDRCHLGHARSMLCFDMVVRFLRANHYEVTFVRNITDIDDKIINRAIELGVSIQTLTSQYIAAMHEDMEQLGLLRPDHEPKATEHMPQMMALIQRLIDKKLAYVTPEGDVCFEVATFKDYGKLSQQDLTGLLAGARVEATATKRSPLDFVLWKPAKPDEPSWDSPWGKGRPGWHLECSAMSMSVLGEQFDIHGGGIDLRFPHHENEIAQSEGATDKCFANYWMHAGLLHINQEKMAKSSGNFLTIQDVLKQYPAEVIRYFFLGSHYRSVLNYSDEGLTQAHRALQRLYQALKQPIQPNAIHHTAAQNISTPWVEAFFQAMNDDFNTPEALGVLFDLSHAINKTPCASLISTLKHLGSMLGILQDDPTLFLQLGSTHLETTQIEQRIADRNRARSEKDFKRADEIRQQLLTQGILLEDAAGETTWRYDKPSS